MRELSLALHILGAAGWIGGGLYGRVTYSSLARNSASSGRALHTLSEKADRFFGPVAVITLVTGVALVWTQDPWGWTDTFVLFGFGAFVFSGVFQPLVSSENEKRLLGAIERGEDAAAELRSSNRSFAIETAVLLVVLWPMVAKLGA